MLKKYIINTCRQYQLRPETPPLPPPSSSSADEHTEQDNYNFVTLFPQRGCALQLCISLCTEIRGDDP